jgi:hypothetical protein
LGKSIGADHVDDVLGERRVTLQKSERNVGEPGMPSTNLVEELAHDPRAQGVYIFEQSLNLRAAPEIVWKKRVGAVLPEHLVTLDLNGGGFVGHREDHANEDEAERLKAGRPARPTLQRSGN